MTRRSSYPAELRERAVRMVFEVTETETIPGSAALMIDFAGFASGPGD